MKISIDLTINEELYQLEVEPQQTLLEVLRDSMHLTGTKEGCGLGDCGSCMVLMDGKPVNACLMLVLDARGSRITTIEGLDASGELHPLQRSFVEKGAVQCGFCTSGMILSAKALLDVNPDASKEEIQRALSGVLCRCGTYPKVIEAVREAGKEIKGNG